MTSIINPLDASSPQQNATVSASAGTGKTWLLVTRIMRLLFNDVEPGNILAITFTRKAAAEMQHRLSERLYELLQCDEQELEKTLTAINVPCDNHTLQRARQLYEELLLNNYPVNILTFHSFCQDLLSKFPLEADIPPGFELVEQTFDLQQEALESLFTEASKYPDSDIATALETLFVELNGLQSTRTALMEFLNYRSDWWAFTNGKKLPVSYAQDSLLSLLALNNPDHDVTSEFFQHNHDNIKAFMQLLADDPGKNNDKNHDIISGVLSVTQKGKSQFFTIKPVFITEKNTIRIRKPSKAVVNRMGAAKAEKLIELHQHIANECLQCIDKLNLQRTYTVNSAWYLAGHRLLEIFQHIKLQQRLLDFSDLEWKTYLLLNQSNHAHWVQYKVDKRIDHILIDEFQDTNPTQWQFLLPLLEEMRSGESQKPRSVFLVGDEKQSIYGFRRAEPRLFSASSDWLQKHLSARAYPQDKSRRSSEAIMQFVNLVFAEGYFNEKLYSFHEHSTVHNELWGRVEILPLLEAENGNDEQTSPDDLPLRNPLESPRILPDESLHYKEGIQIADRIRDLINNKTVITLDDKDRFLAYSDILILVRGRNHIRDYEKALREFEIPYQGIERGTLLESIEIKDMIALLNVLFMPDNNLALAVALRSPVFSCSEENLILLAQKPAARSWYEQLAHLYNDLQSHHPLARAFRLVSRWRELSGQLPVHDLLDTIYSEGNVIARYAAASPDHLKSQTTANLTRFIELALEIDSGRYPSLSRFLSKLKFTRENKKESPDEGQLNAQHNCVRILTIHASKGLEAPVVFLADAEHADKDSFANKALIDWPPQAVRPDSFILLSRKNDLDAVSRGRIEQHKQAEQREKTNLLYVAITRARQLLFISASKTKNNKAQGWYSRILERLEQTEQDINNGFVLESGIMPKTVQTAPPDPVVNSAELDQRLFSKQALPLQHNTVRPSEDKSLPDSSTNRNDNESAIRGTIVHALLDLLCNSEMDKDTARKRLASEIQLDVSTQIFENCWKEASAVVNDPRFMDLYDKSQFDKAYNEVPVQYQWHGKQVNGIIDRLVIRDDTAIIVDYKTHENVSEKNKSEIAERYSEQMRLYQNGISLLWPEKKTISTILFTTPRILYEF